MYGYEGCDFVSIFVQKNIDIAQWWKIKTTRNPLTRLEQSKETCEIARKSNPLVNLLQLLNQPIASTQGV